MMLIQQHANDFVISLFATEKDKEQHYGKILDSFSLGQYIIRTRQILTKHVRPWWRYLLKSLSFPFFFSGPYWSVLLTLI